ncbi:hypothetical protein C8R47DRAFT_1327689, partial [Mycena vitilis]
PNLLPRCRTPPSQRRRSPWSLIRRRKLRPNRWTRTPSRRPKQRSAACRSQRVSLACRPVSRFSQRASNRRTGLHFALHPLIAHTRRPTAAHRCTRLCWGIRTATGSRVRT